ncbi:unnamed protein product [Tuber aestivum]|uniref:Uncharacterized protein n=1 Tax=Tuber aestivum TaxID=59557 RepID=A0A292PHZ3_9PEZI|nr:unnamed protein product [Tuber aestivum]
MSDEPSSGRTRCDSVVFLARDHCGRGLCRLVFPLSQRLPIRRPSPAGHNIEETTKDAFSSNDECALINKDLDEHDGDSGFSSHHGRSGSVTSYDTSYDAHPDNPILWGGEGSAYPIDCTVVGHSKKGTNQNGTPTKPSNPFCLASYLYRLDLSIDTCDLNPS